MKHARPASRRRDPSRNTTTLRRDGQRRAKGLTKFVYFESTDVAPAALILSFTHLSTILVRLSSGRLFAPCSVSIQHSSAALLWVSGWGAGSAGGVPVRLVVQLARITAAISGSPKWATVELFIADPPEVLGD
jgi:hypothetical protein